MNVERGGEPGRLMQFRYTLLAAVLVLLAGCVSPDSDETVFEVQPVEVVAHLDQVNQTVHFAVTNVGTKPTVLELVFQSPSHWRGFAGAGKWSTSGNLLLAPDHLVLLDEDARVVPWRDPPQSRSFPPGSWSAVHPESATTIEPGGTYSWELRLDEFEVEDGRLYTIEYQIYGERGKLGPFRAEEARAGGSGPSSGADVAAAFLAITALEPRSTPDGAWLELELTNIGHRPLVLQTELVCTERPGTAPPSTTSFVWLEPGDEDGLLACQMSTLDQLEGRVAPGDGLRLVVPRETWNAGEGRSLLDLILVIQACAAEGETCVPIHWEVRCQFIDGFAAEPNHPPMASNGDGTRIDEPASYAPPGFYMMGVEDEPAACRVDWFGVPWVDGG